MNPLSKVENSHLMSHSLLPSLFFLPMFSFEVLFAKNPSVSTTKTMATVTETNTVILEAKDILLQPNTGNNCGALQKV